MSKPIIAVDIDEVLAQFIPSLAVFHNEVYGSVTGLEDNTVQPALLTTDSFVSYEFHKVWGGTFEEANAKMAAFFDSHHFKERIEPVPHAKEVLIQLKENYSLHIVTARQYAVEEITRAWINHHYPDIFDEIHFGNHYSTEGRSRSKLEICHEIGAQLLIDDSIVYAAQCARGNEQLTGFPVILFGHYPWNKEFPHKEAPHIQANTRTQNVKEAFVVHYHEEFSEEDLKIFTEYHQKPVIRVKTWHEVLHSIQLVIPCNYYQDHLVVTKNSDDKVITRNQLHVIALQICSTNMKLENFNMIESMIAETVRNYETCNKNKLDLVCLPECALFIGRDSDEILSNAEEISEVEGSVLKLSELAKKHSIWLSVGGFAEKSSNSKIHNAHFLINRDGQLIAPIYRKIHLFDCPFTGLQESLRTEAGCDLVVHDIEGWKVGLSICYDLRFPLLYDSLQRISLEKYQSPLDLLLIPAAFTIPTGQAHWEILLRARAIENQCYVIAAAQTGQHNDKRASYGHSMIIDPWGKIVAHLTEETHGICEATLEKERLYSLRRDMPILDHKRYDVYGMKK